MHGGYIILDIYKRYRERIYKRRRYKRGREEGRRYINYKWRSRAREGRRWHFGRVFGVYDNCIKFSLDVCAIWRYIESVEVMIGAKFAQYLLCEPKC